MRCNTSCRATLSMPVQTWGEELCARSPTAIAERSIDVDTALQAGIVGLGRYALELYYDTEEPCEGSNAPKEKVQA
jgi:2-ketocyclohexanecarboxyl-CoA hydrolase